MTREELKNKLDELINEVIYGIQTEEGITSGDCHFELEMRLEDNLEALTDSITAIIDYQKSLMLPAEEIEEEYCDTSDTTFLVKYVYLNGNLKSREVISFYSGEPNAKDTEHYSTKGLGVKCEYEL